MARDNSDNGLGNLLGLVIIAMIIGSVVYSAWDRSVPVEQPVEQPQVVQQPQGVTTDQLIEKLGLGDGTLGAAQPLSASDMGKATPVTGGGISTGSSGTASNRRSSSSSSGGSSGGGRSGG